MGGCCRWEIEQANGSVIDEKENFLLLIYYLNSLDDKHSASVSLKQNLALWLVLSCMCTQWQLGFSGWRQALYCSLSPGAGVLGSPLTFGSPPFIFPEDFMCLQSPVTKERMRQMNSSRASPMSVCNRF